MHTIIHCIVQFRVDHGFIIYSTLYSEQCTIFSLEVSTQWNIRYCVNNGEKLIKQLRLLTSHWSVDHSQPTNQTTIGQSIKPQHWDLSICSEQLLWNQHNCPGMQWVIHLDIQKFNVQVKYVYILYIFNYTIYIYFTGAWRMYNFDWQIQSI